jgi:hypothetical protein
VRAEGVFVTEELVAKLDELGPQVGTRKVRGRGSIESELTEDVPETTAEVEQLLASLETSDNVGLFWRRGDVEIQVAPAANAAIRENSKGLFTLRGRLARGKVGWVTGCNATHNCDDMGVDLTGWNMAVGLEQLPCIGKVGSILRKVLLVTPGQFLVFSFRHLSAFRVSRNRFYAEQL